MGSSDENTRLMTNNNSDIKKEIKVNGEKLETVTSFKYLNSVVTDEGCEILSRIAQTTELMNGSHVHTTSVCVFLRWSGGLRVVR